MRKTVTFVLVLAISGFAMASPYQPVDQEWTKDGHTFPDNAPFAAFPYDYIPYATSADEVYDYENWHNETFDIALELLDDMLDRRVVNPDLTWSHMSKEGMVAIKRYSSQPYGKNLKKFLGAYYRTFRAKYDAHWKLDWKDDPALDPRTLALRNSVKGIPRRDRTRMVTAMLRALIHHTMMTSKPNPTQFRRLAVLSFGTCVAGLSLDEWHDDIDMFLKEGYSHPSLQWRHDTERLPHPDIVLGKLEQKSNAWTKCQVSVPRDPYDVMRQANKRCFERAEHVKRSAADLGCTEVDLDMPLEKLVKGFPDD